MVGFVTFSRRICWEKRIDIKVDREWIKFEKKCAPFVILAEVLVTKGIGLFLYSIRN